MVKYKSRSAEDIVEMVKPLLETNILTITDEVLNIGNRYYIKATAKLFDEAGILIAEASAFARESENPPVSKEGKDLMTVAQLSGATSSYARKYALNGLFAIDDTQDDDTTEQATRNDINTVLKNQTRSENDYQEDDFNL